MLLVTLALKTLPSISQNGISPITLNKQLGNHFDKDSIKCLKDVLKISPVNNSGLLSGPVVSNSGRSGLYFLAVGRRDALEHADVVDGSVGNHQTSIAGNKINH